MSAGELVVDSFAGGGGASTGIEMALGRSPDIAINHDPEAIAMHAANHPRTRHYCENVWDVDPRMATGGKPVGLAWFSPDCKHFSKAKGGKPVDKNIRGLANVVIEWARAVRPRVIILENVEEFKTWGPLIANEDGDLVPDPTRAGEDFDRWWGELEALGYRGELRQLRACDYGAPTSRRRLFIVFRCDGNPITWPEPTHGAGLLSYRAAAECIDWSIPCPSIFDRKRPLAEKTMARIARGIRRYVIDAADPFIVPATMSVPALIQKGWGERVGQAPRILDIHAPLGTIVAGGIKQALVSAFLAKHNGGNEATGQELRRPIDTITCRDTKAIITAELSSTPVDQVRAFLLKYYGAEQDPRLNAPLHTITTRHRFGLVTVRGADYYIADIGMRMLEPRELFNAQGFPRDYIIDRGADGELLTKTAQVRMVGNSVAPHLACALVNANYVVQEMRKSA